MGNVFHYPFDPISIRTKMTEKEFNKKWGDVDTDELMDTDWERFKEFKNDCFLLYETYGFTETFDSPYDQYAEKKGLPIKVLRRATEEECDVEAMPLWVVKIGDEEEPYYCYPEEISLFEKGLARDL